MKKIFKVVAIILACFVLLAITGTTLLGLFIDPNDYKEEIQQAALDNAQINLQINGDISWTIYPSIGLEIKSIQVSYPNKAALASLDNARVSVMLMPLLSGKVETKTISVQGLSLNLVKEGNSTNWQSDLSSAAKTSEQDTSPADDTRSKRFKSFDIKSISIADANIIYTDKDSGQIISITDFNLATDRVISNTPFDAQLDFNLAINNKDGQALSTQLDLQANFNLDLANQRYIVKQLSSQIKIITDREFNLVIGADIDANLQKNTITVSNLALGSAKLKATGTLQASGADFSAINGNLALEKFDLKALLQDLNLPAIATSKDSSLRNISFNTEIKGTASALNFSKLSLNIDKTKISGAASYQLGTGLIGFDLAGDSININSYLPAETTVTQTPATANKAKNQSSAYSKENIIPIQVLKSLKLKGQLNFKHIQYQKTKLSNLVLKIDANKGLVKITKLNISVYAGSITNNITLDARKKTLRINITNSIKNLQIGPMLQDFAQSDMMTGALNSSSQLSLSGQSVHSLVNSLSGKTNISLAKGVINGINAAQEMCETVNSIASLGGAISTTQAVDKATPFASIKGNFKLKNGVISNSDFNADLDAINAKGKGSINLAKQSLDYRLGLKIQDNLFNKSCSVNNKIQDIEWPIDCKGKFSDDPMKLCKPDLSIVKDILKKAVKDKLKRAVEKKLGTSIKEKKKEIKEKIEEKVKDKLKDALKGLF